MSALRPWLVRAAVALLALCAGAAALAQELQIIEMRYRLAEEIVPILQPLVEPGGVLTGSDRVLFVRTSAANFEQIRQAVAALDRRPRQLLVTVGQGTLTRDAGAGVRGTATAGSGDVQVGVNAPPGVDAGATVVARGGTAREDVRNVSSVRTLEGAETYIAVGQLAPLSTTEVVTGPGWHGPAAVTSTGYRDVSTGFYATVRLSGNRVTLDLSPRQQHLRATADGPVIETAGGATTVSGRLGEWLALGAVRESGGGEATGLLLWSRRTAESQYSAWVKVEEVP
jgi:hypothetical protein